jgi:thymidylate synthase ThyX
MSIDDVDSSLYKTGDKTIDTVNSITLKTVLGMHGKNDILKYSVPEAMLTRAILTLNLRSFRHVVQTRTGRDVLEEYRKLVLDMVAALPVSHRVFVEDCIQHETIP